MKLSTRLFILAPVILLATGVAYADNYADAASGASGGKSNATTDSAGYRKGVAVFTIAKGGLMFTASLAGQRFTYTSRGAG